MATTTNFSWATPDDSANVKDGAAAIRSLGTAIDTSLVDLKGGTTGQTLTKATNTDMDFAWATSSSGGMNLISTTTLSGATTISSIPQTYNTLTGVIFGTTNTAGPARLRIAPNGSTSLTSTVMTYASNQTDVAHENSESSYWFLTNQSGTWNTLNYNAINFTIYNYTSTLRKAIEFSGSYLNSTGGFLQNIMGAGQIQTTSGVTSLTFSTNNGSFNGGTVLLYGVK
jgi:hypothetical protein